KFAPRKKEEQASNTRSPLYTIMSHLTNLPSALCVATGEKRALLLGPFRILSCYSYQQLTFKSTP
ncbi:hypothetical protein, partial [Staphylococcus aureus]|uniref:hypothetical protein n=1 Tax=Staphylococcus aureus TaxID=1280 RepID=UPI001C4024BB